MKAVADATPLIHLAKIGRLHLLKELFKEILIENKVYEEVIEKGREHHEVPLIQQAIEEKFIKVVEAKNKIEIPSLHEGEKKSISLCLNLQIKNVLIDDEEGFHVATMLNLTPLRTTTLLIILLDKKFMGLKEYEDSLNTLSESGYFLDASTYTRLLTIGKNIVRDA